MKIKIKKLKITTGLTESMRNECMKLHTDLRYIILDVLVCQIYLYAIFSMHPL